MGALVAEREAARLQHVASQEITGQREPVGYVMTDGFGVTLAEECRQPQHLVGPGLARGARYRPARLWRDKNQVAGRPGCDAAIEIETKPQFGQELQFEPHNHRGSDDCIVEMTEDVTERLVKSGVRISLG